MAKRPSKRGANNSSKAPTKPAKKMLPIKYEVPEDMTAIFASNFVVQNDGPDFHLFFFQHAHPVIVPGSPGSKDAFEALSELPAICVAKIAITGARMQGIVDALTANLKAWQERMAAEQALAAAEADHGR